MKKLLLGTVGLAALAVPALAADMGVVRRPVAYVAATNWTGCYVGGDVGDSWGTHDGYSATGATTQVTSGVPVPAGTPISGSFNTSGFTGGFYGGCNYQVGVWVFGVEGEWSNVNNEGQSFELLPPARWGRFGLTRRRSVGSSPHAAGWATLSTSGCYMRPAALPGLKLTARRFSLPMPPPPLFNPITALAGRLEPGSNMRSPMDG